MASFRLISNRVDAVGVALRAVAAAAAMASVFAPPAASAALFGGPAHAAAESSLAFKSTPGSIAGAWAYRSIAVSGDPKATLAKLALGNSEFNLTEQGGQITGTRPGAKGKTYPVTGFVVYGPRKAPQVVLHSTSEVNGKTYEYDYFGYLMPSWTVSGAQPDTIVGTVVRTDPQAPEAPAIVASFIATRELAGAPKAAAAPTPAAKPAVAPTAKPAAAAPAAK